MAERPDRTTLRHAGDVSVVVCTYSMDRWGDLERALESVLAQPEQPDELLVVTDHADDVADAVRRRFPQVRVVPNERKQGLSGARNTALAHTDLPVVVFLDDDATARAGWLEALVAPFGDDRVLGVGGRILPAWDDARPGWWPPEFDWVVGCTHAGSRTDAGPIRNPVGASMAYRTARVRDAGGFQESLGRVGTRPLGCEETEASIRMSQRHPGGVFLFAPDSVVDHRVPPARAQWSYFRSRCYAEGLSKAYVRTLSREPLATERSYATSVLPRAVARNLLGVLGGDTDGFRRAAAVVAGLAVTTLGYVVGIVTQARATRHTRRVRRSNRSRDITEERAA